MVISGVMRRDELTKMSNDDIQDENSVQIVTVPDTKSGIDMFDFRDWCNKKNVKTMSKNVVLAYLMEK
jgi:hypothetical protein